MKYQIRFTAGELTGECHELTPGETFSLGRSHSNRICLHAPDVSGKHLIIRPFEGGSVSAEVLSSRITMHNGKKVGIGDIFELHAGDTVQMGADVIFAVEAAGAAPAADADSDKTVMQDSFRTVAPAADADGDKTVLAPSAPAPSAPPAPEHDTLPDGGVTLPVQAAPVPAAEESQATLADGAPGAGGAMETVAFQTRVASDEELENIKKNFRAKYRKKVVLIALPIFLFFLTAVLLYIYLKPNVEKFVTWPTDRKGEYLNEFQQLAPYLALVYPKAAGCAAKTSGATTEIDTKIGKRQDVRLHIIATAVSDPATLRVDHGAAFDAWMERMRAKESTLSFSGERRTIFLNTSVGAGVPMSMITYSRRIGNDDYWGYALFLRNAETIHTVMIEVPIGERWRATPLLRAQVPSMVIYAIKRSEGHWEGGSSFREKTTPEQDIDEAARFMEREAPVYWGRIFYLIRSALIKATLSKDSARVSEAQNMLIKLRRQQTVWYNTQKLAYQYAQQSESFGTMRSIQAMGESVFSVEFQYADFRYDLIKRKDWK